MIEVSIDMSTNDETSENRIFGRVIDIQGDTLICEYTCANYDFEKNKKINELKEKLKIAEKALRYYAKSYNGYCSFVYHNGKKIEYSTYVAEQALNIIQE